MGAIDPLYALPLKEGTGLLHQQNTMVTIKAAITAYICCRRWEQFVI